MNIEIDDNFAGNPRDDKSYVYQVFPDIHEDNRGFFTEIFHDDASWIKQINMSKSCKNVFRGLHAQFGKYCQGKLVRAINYPIYDIIIDMRPDSKSFGLKEMYYLDPNTQNQLWIPRGFLHGFLTTEDDSIFEYMCDNIYDKESEITVNPYNAISTELCPDINHDLIFSDKDLHGKDFHEFKSTVKNQFEETGELWYR